MPRDYPAKDSNNNNDHDRRRRRAGTALTVENFAHRKGVTKAIQSFRKRKDDKRTETAKALRRYKKTMKQEGYEPGRGASRKRDNVDEEEEQISTGAAGTVTTSEQQEQNSQKQPYQKRAKSNPFQKTLKKAEEKKQQLEKAAHDREANEHQREKKLKDRRKRSKNMRARTSKGQPVMKHVIHDILRKLERDKEQEGK